MSATLDSQEQSETSESYYNDFFTDAEWPDACPVSNEENIITIVCGNDYHSWALHRNVNNNNQYHPSLFWQTLPIKPSEDEEKNQDLYKFIPSQVRCIIYGPKPIIAPLISDNYAVKVYDLTKADEKEASNDVDIRNDADNNENNIIDIDIDDDDEPQDDRNNNDNNNHSHSNKRRKLKKWQNDEIQRLNHGIQLYGRNNLDKLANAVKTRTDQQIKQLFMNVAKGKSPYILYDDMNDNNATNNTKNNQSSVRPSRRSSLTSKKSLPLEGTLDDSSFYKTERAVQYRATLRVPAITVFIFGIDTKQVLEVTKLFRYITSRVFRLSTSDFIIPNNSVDENDDDPSIHSKEEIIKSNDTIDDDEDFYSEMDFRRLCQLRGAQIRYTSQSLLIIDTGTCRESPISYTATDSSGTLIGGGIAVSIDMKLQGLLEQSKRILPEVTKEYLRKYMKERKAISITNESTNESTNNDMNFSFQSLECTIAETVLKETVLSMSKIIVKWIDENQKKFASYEVQTSGEFSAEVLDSSISIVAASSTANSTTKSLPKVSKSLAAPVLILTGNDSELLQQLLICDNSSNVRDFSDGDMMSVINNAVNMKKIKVDVVKALSLWHHGVQVMLMQQYKLKAEDRNEDVRDAVIGQRVAIIPDAIDSEIASIVFNNENLKSRSKILFGSVVNIIRNGTGLGKDYYSIFWDESCSIDDVGATRLYECLILYTKANEDMKEKDGNRRNQLRKKSEEAKETASLLIQRCKEVQNFHASKGEQGDGPEDDDVSLQINETETSPPIKPSSLAKTDKKKPRADTPSESTGTKTSKKRKLLESNNLSATTSLLSNEKKHKRPKSSSAKSNPSTSKKQPKDSKMVASNAANRKPDQEIEQTTPRKRGRPRKSDP